MSSVTGSEIGKASGPFNMLCYLGGVFGIGVLVAVFAHTGNFRSTQAFTEGFALPIGACASLSLVAPPKEQASISLTYHSQKAIAHRSSRGIKTTEAKYRASLIYPKDDG